MPPRAKKEAAAPLLKDESLPLLNYGAELFKQYEATTPAPSVRELQMARFGDYAHHFGFSLEREQAMSSGSRALPSLHPRSLATGSLGRKRAQTSMMTGNEAVEEAGWEMPPEEKAAADAQCDAVGALRDATPQPAVLVPLICEPFQTVNWRQTRLQCELKKARCLYRWLCQHVRVVLESEIARAAALRAKALAEEESKKPKGKGGRTASPNKRGNTAANKSSVVADGAGSLDEGAQAASNPLEEALRTRVATPHTLADLYAGMLHEAGVPCEVVRGWIKGSACEETHSWCWNMVQINGKSYLVDVASSTFDGTLRIPKATSPAGTDQGAGGAAATARGGANSNTNKTDANKAKRGDGVAAGVHTVGEADDTSLSGVAEDVAPHRCVRFTSQRQRVEDFYFFCHPLQFIYTHLPVNDRHTLLAQPPHRAVWTGAPRLAHDFFRFPIALHSHQRSAAFTVRSTPFYISLINRDPATTELACKIYRGSLADLPELLHETRLSPASASRAAGGGGAKRREEHGTPETTAAAPPPASTLPPSGAAGEGTAPGAALSLDWVWQQRCESTQTETFTVMTPDVGYYSVVIGARRIRRDPYSAVIATGPFTPLVRYQAKVNFVPSSSPLVPRQHLSPSVCRLMTPLSVQVQTGSCTVSVMPSCSNVAAVAVVARTARQPPPPLVAPHTGGGVVGTKATSNAPQAEDDPEPPVHREVLAFLPFSTSAAVYSGSVSLTSGMGVEVWVLYTAPDENGLTFRDRVKHRVAAMSAASALSPGDVPSGAPAPGGVSRDEAGAAPASKGRPNKTKSNKSGSATNVAPVEDTSARRRAALETLLEQGRAFRPFVTGIEARKLITSDVKDLIQPQPTIGEEREPTLRRLMGITDALYQEATTMRQQEVQPVGTYLDARAPGTAKARGKAP